MFYSQDLACVLLEQGRVEDFLRMFYVILAANVSHETLTTCEWLTNTQPHIHSISSLVRMFRTMMIQERDGGLYLLQGTPRRWLDQGKEILIKEAPTWYGPLSLACTSAVDEGKLRIRLDLPPRLAGAPIHLRLRLPEPMGDRGGLGEWPSVEGSPGRLDRASKDLRGHADVQVKVWCDKVEIKRHQVTRGLGAVQVILLQFLGFAAAASCSTCIATGRWSDVAGTIERAPVHQGKIFSKVASDCNNRSCFSRTASQRGILAARF